MLKLQLNEDDSNFIKRKKSEVLKKYKPTQSASIELTNHLSVYLLTLGLYDDALKLLESYSDNSPFSEHHPQRWEAIIQAKALLAYLHINKSNTKKSEALINPILEIQIDPAPLGKEKYLSRLHDSIESNFLEVCEATPMESCIITAELYLLYIYGMVVKPESVVYLKKHKNKDSELEASKILDQLRLFLNKVR